MKESKNVNEKLLFSLELKNEFNEVQCIELFDWKLIWEADKSKLMKNKNYNMVKAIGDVGYIDLLRELCLKKPIIDKIVLRKANNFTTESPFITYENSILGKVDCNAEFYFMASSMNPSNNFMNCYDRFSLNVCVSLKMQIPAKTTYFLDFERCLDIN